MQTSNFKSQMRIHSAAKPEQHVAHISETSKRANFFMNEHENEILQGKKPLHNVPSHACAAFYVHSEIFKDTFMEMLFLRFLSSLFCDAICNFYEELATNL